MITISAKWTRPIDLLHIIMHAVVREQNQYIGRTWLACHAWCLAMTIHVQCTMRYWRQFGGTDVNMIINIYGTNDSQILSEILPRITIFGTTFPQPLRAWLMIWQHKWIDWTQNTANLAHWKPERFPNDKNCTVPLSRRFKRFSAYHLCH